MSLQALATYLVRAFTIFKRVNMPAQLLSFPSSMVLSPSGSYVDLDTGQSYVRVSQVLSHGQDPEQIRYYHAIAVGDGGVPDYTRADDICRFSQWYGTAWHTSIQRELELTGQSHALPPNADKFYSETQVWHSGLGFAGTFDLLYHIPDEGWILRDFKTHSRWKSEFEESADIGYWTIDRSIQSQKKTKWREQLSAYWDAIEYTMGIRLSGAEIYCLNAHTWKASVVLRQSRKANARALTRFLKKLRAYRDETPTVGF